MSNPTHICWVDLETTDTEPYSAHAAILEVGVIVTRHDPPLTEVGRASLLIRPPGLTSDMDLMWSRMAPVVQSMHQTSGLWEDATTSDEAWNLAEADTELANWLESTVTGDGGHTPVPLAGSGVAHLDSGFIRAHMPVLQTRLTYWMLDVGVQRRMFALAGREDHVHLVEDVEAKPHRGLADVDLHVREARRYLQVLASSGVDAAAKPAEPVS